MSKIIKICLIAGSFILLFLTISPVLNSGYINDDALNSQLPGILAEQQTDVFSFSFSTIRSWLTGLGRFYPFSFLSTYSLFSIVSNLFLYKLFLVFMILLNALLLFWLVKLVSKQLPIAILSILFVPIFLKITKDPNPILSFCGLLQWVLMCILFSLIALVYYFERGKKWYLVLSMVFYFFSLMLYEISYTLFILHVVIIFSFYGFKPLYYKIRASILVFSMALLAFCITISLRLLCGFSPIPVNSGQYSFNLDVGTFFSSIVHNLVAVIPLSYTLFDPNKLFTDRTALYSQSSMVMLVCIGVISFVLLFISSKLILRNYGEKETRYLHQFPILLFGIGLTVLPLLMLSVSTRWQSWSGLGNAYLPIYLSAFGGSVCLVSFYYFIYKITIKNSIIVTIFCGLFSLIFALSCISVYASNNRVVKNENIAWLYPRETIEDGMDNDLFKGISNDSTIIIQHIHMWDQIAFFRMHTGIHFSKITTLGNAFLDQTPIDKALSQSKLIEQSRDISHYSFSDEDKIYYLEYSSASENEGHVFLFKITDLLVSNSKEIITVNTNKASFFIKSNQLNEKNNIFISGQGLTQGLEDMPVFLSESDMRLLDQGKRWKMLAIEKSTLRVNPLSLKINIASKDQPPFTEWSGGFTGLEGKIGDDTRWCSSNGIMTIINPSDQNKKVAIIAVFKTGYSDFSNLKIESDLINEDLRINSGGLNYQRELVIPPGCHIVKFYCDAKKLDIPVKTRIMVFATYNFRMTEIK
jgi:hypothetical protein